MDIFTPARSISVRALLSDWRPTFPLLAVACGMLAVPVPTLAQENTPDPELAPDTELASRERAIVPWFGFALSCSDCTIGRRKWTFSSPPKVYLVDPAGPADRAGLRKGDVLTHVDGAAITSGVAKEALNGASPDDTLRFRYLRDGRRIEADLVVGAYSPQAAQAVARAAAEMRRAEEAAEWSLGAAEDATGASESRAGRDAGGETDMGLRYAGMLGSVAINVTSSEPVMVDEFTDAVVIRAPGTTIRLAYRGLGCKAGDDP